MLESAQLPRRKGRRLAWAGVAAAVLLILGSTVSPADVRTLLAGRFSANDLLLTLGRYGPADAVRNVLLYMPLGWTLGVLFSRAGRERMVGRSSGAIFAVAAIAFALSYGIESLQRLMPGRAPSIVDVAANVAGALAGCAAWELIQLGDRRLLLVSYVAAVLAGGAFLQRMTSLETWDPSYYLLVGNEETADRAWRGKVSALYLADRVASTAEAGKMFAQPASDMDLRVLTDFRSDAQRLIRRRPRLIWLGRTDQRPIASRSSLAPRGVRVGFDGYLRSERAVWDLVGGWAETSQLTVAVKAAAAVTDQRASGRIVSISKDPNQRNFSLLQVGEDLVCRLRTAVTGQNGLFPELVVPGVFRDSEYKEIVVTYDGSMLAVSVDGVPRPETLVLGPGAAAASLFLHLTPTSVRVAEHLFRVVVFALLGLGVVWVAGRSVGLTWTLAAIVATALATAASLEGLLNWTSGGRWTGAYLADSVMWALVGSLPWWASGALVPAWRRDRISWPKWS